MIRKLMMAVVVLAAAGCERSEMKTDDLNAKFGAPGRIVFRQGFAGYPEVALANKYGSAVVALLGANVLSYRPTGLGETLFRPAKRDYNRGDKFHGGIPLCWPQFGRRFSADLPQHGFASKMPFEVRGTEYTEEKTSITLGLRPDDATRGLWQAEFDLEVTITVSMKLNVVAKTTNAGKEPFAFSCGFHPYFLVRERGETAVRGLDGVKFFDARGEEIVEGVQKGDLALTFAPDHVFALPSAPRHEFAVLDDKIGRAVAIASRGNDMAVVWNSGDGTPCCDHESGDWRRFICVEPVSDWPGGRTLAPGESYELEMAIQTSLKK